MKYMLDTNICIYAIKKKPEKVLQKLQGVDSKDICISMVTYADLMHGVEKSEAVEKNRLALSVLLANIEVDEFDFEAANQYGIVRSELEKKGTPIGPLDFMIAAHAISKGCVLVTNNVNEFSRIKGLKIENWAE